MPVAMLLAAGRGQRMGALTDHCPKPLLPIGATTLIGNHIANLSRAGFQKIIINAHYLQEMLPQALGDGSDWGVELIYSFESQVLETAGGIIHALPLLGAGSFVVINADIYCDYPLQHLAATAHALDQQRQFGAHLLLVANPAHHPTGDFVLKNHTVYNLTPNAPALTFSGIGVYRRDFFAGLPQGKRALGDLLRENADQGRVRGEFYQGDWQDIGTPERLARLQQQLRA